MNTLRHSRNILHMTRRLCYGHIDSLPSVLLLLPNAKETITSCEQPTYENNGRGRASARAVANGAHAGSRIRDLIKLMSLGLCGSTKPIRRARPNPAVTCDWFSQRSCWDGGLRRFFSNMPTPQSHSYPRICPPPRAEAASWNLGSGETRQML